MSTCEHVKSANNLGPIVSGKSSLIVILEKKKKKNVIYKLRRNRDKILTHLYLHSFHWKKSRNQVTIITSAAVFQKANLNE